jgi:hypothetical protein
MFRRLIQVVGLTSLAALAATSRAELVHVQSGNGGGPLDSMVTMLVGNPAGDFAPLIAADFMAAQTGPSANILSSLAGGWVSGLPGSTAMWIGTGPDSGQSTSTALYAIQFNLANAAPVSFFDVFFSVDDQLGGANNVGIFLDGSPIPGSRSGVDWNGVIEHHVFGTGPLSAGTHTLYFDANNGGGPAGLIFSGTVQAVPEPATFAIFGVAALGFLKTRRRK